MPKRRIRMCSKLHTFYFKYALPCANDWEIFLHHNFAAWVLTLWPSRSCNHATKFELKRTSTVWYKTSHLNAPSSVSGHLSSLGFSVNVTYFPLHKEKKCWLANWKMWLIQSDILVFFVYGVYGCMGTGMHTHLRNKCWNNLNWQW